MFGSSHASRARAAVPASLRLAGRRAAPALFESLEGRQLFAAAFPTAQEQYLVELINRARANPTAEVQRLSSIGAAPVALSRAGWAVTASNNPGEANLATDGNLGTRWSSNAPMAPGMYYQIDLGSAQTFNRVEFDAAGSSADFAASYQILTSATGTDWDTRQPVTAGNGLSAKITAVFAAQTARYVRIVQTGTKPEGWWWSIHEVNVFAPAATPGNIAGWGGTPDLNEGLPAGSISADAKQPVAIDPNLTDSARDHASWMQSSGNLSHDDARPGKTTATDRAVAAGYAFPAAPPTPYVGENIWWSSSAVNQTAYVDQMQAGLFIDNLGPANGTISARGHRAQLLNPLAKLIGVGHAFGSDGQGYSAENFTNVNSSRAYLTGVTYRDSDNNNFYTPGEGLGGVTITATRISDGQVFTTTTWDAGGYTLQLADGAYTVTASGGGIGTPIPQTVTVAARNVKADFNPRDTPPPPPAAAAPTILQQPADLTVQSKNILKFTSDPVSFSTAASGTPAPTYQWQSAAAGGAFADIPGATGAVYTFSPVEADSLKQYRCVVTNAGGSATSNAATLTLTGVGTYITTRPQDQTVNAGAVVTLNSAASGTNNVISWESVQVLSGQNYAVIPGATSSSYTFTATPEMAGKTFFYRVRYTNSKNPSLTDQAVAAVTVNATPAAPVVAAAPVGTSATAGGTATLATAVVGGADATIQWQQASPAPAVNADPSARDIPASAAGATYTDVPGLTGATVSFPVTADMSGKLYRAVITNSAGTVVTAPVTLTVNDASFVANELANLRQRVAEATQALADCKAGVRADAARLAADLDRLGATKAERKLVSALLKRESKARSTLTKRQSKVFKALVDGVKKLDKLYAKAQANPADAKAAAKLSAAIAKLQAAAAANTVPADASRCVLGVQADLVPIAAVAPSDVDL
ncbi:MAG TPA: discoidin domain-containing protein, partial [Humisphaera sp.]